MHLWKKMETADVTLAGFTRKGYRCVCGEEVFNALGVEKIRKALNEKIKARKVAHSLVVTLPQSLAELTKIHAGQSLRWKVADNQLILEKS